MELKRQAKLSLVLFNIFVFVLCVTSLMPSALCGEIFSWTDKSGVQHYSNVKHPASVQNMQIYEEKKSVDSKILAYDIDIDIKKVIKNNKKKTKRNEIRDNIKVKVIKIYDGDSMKVKGDGIEFSVRLIGIDAPESKGKNSSKSKSASKIAKLLGIKPPKLLKKGNGQPFNKESKQALTKLIGKKDIRIKSYGTDRYNRVLAELFTDDGTLVNLEMVKLGMAEVYRGTTEKGFDLSPYKRAESEAKRAKRGIWSLGSDYESPKEWRKGN